VYNSIVRYPLGVNLDDTLKLDAQLCFLLYSATRAVTQAYGPLLGPLGLTYPQYLVMLVLWEQDGVSVGKLGERLYLDSGTLTPLLKRMEAQGLVERRRSREDERVVEIHLSPAGRQLRERAVGVPSALFCRTGLTLKAGVRLAEELHQVLDGLKLSNDTEQPTRKDRGQIR
jgi:DNA-binding MarR family transcriptional regulator